MLGPEEVGGTHMFLEPPLSKICAVEMGAGLTIANWPNPRGGREREREE